MFVFFSNRLNNHQVHVADELYGQIGHKFCYVELCRPTVAGNKGSVEDFSKRPYLLPAWKSKENLELAYKYCVEADVCCFSTVYSLRFIEMRLKSNKLSFDVGERWLKKGVANMFSPNLLRFYFYYILNGWGHKKLFKLCCSGFAAEDHAKLHMFKNKCFKWGYFTSVDKDIVIKKHDSNYLRLMWCARFLELKHPELPLKMALQLKNEGYSFILDFYGDEVPGNKSEKQFCRKWIEDYISDNKLGDFVKLHGNKPNHEILEEMRKHDVFLFTSNSLEGWGAVVNEAMANGCAVVSSDKIGSTPYLVYNNITGFRFRDGDCDSLVSRVRWCLNNPEDVYRLRQNAYKQMLALWNPHNAAVSLLKLADCLLREKEVDIDMGPCSKA